jgi:hypothetical protein
VRPARTCASAAILGSFLPPVCPRLLRTRAGRRIGQRPRTPASAEAAQRSEGAGAGRGRPRVRARVHRRAERATSGLGSAERGCGAERASRASAFCARPPRSLRD